MCNWIKRDNEDTSIERNAIKPVDAQWQNNLDAKGLGQTDRAIEMNKNYKTTIGLDASQMREKLRDADIRGHFSNEALKTNRELLQDQTTATQRVSGVDQVKQVLDEERKKR